MKLKMYNKFISLDYLNICFLLLTFGFQCNAKEFSCRKGFKAIEGKCMAMVKYDKGDDRSWQSARTICVGLGGDLAALTTPRLIMAADAIRRAAKMNTLNMYWIGLTDEETEGKFKWTDKQKLTSSEAPWLPGEPDTSNPEEDYVAVSGVGWSDRANKWTKTVNKEVVEPSGFLCETKLFRKVSEMDEKSARPIIIEKRKRPVISVKNPPKDAQGKSAFNDFESAIVDEDAAKVSKSATSKEEKADDFFQAKHDLDFGSPFGQYGADVYPPQAAHKQQHPQHTPPPQSYGGRANFHRGYKPGRVHPSHQHGGGGGHRNSRLTQVYRQPRTGYDNNAQAKSYHNPNPKPQHWYGNNNRQTNRLREFGYPRKQLRQSYHEQQNHDSYKTKQHDSHQVNPYSQKIHSFIQSFNPYARKAPAHYDPNREGFCHKHKPGAYAHPYDCNKFIICYSNYLATEFKCGYDRKWSGNTCVEDKTCNPHRHFSSPKRYFDPRKLIVGEKVNDLIAAPPSTTTTTKST